MSSETDRWITVSLERLVRSDAFLQDARRFAAIPSELFEAALEAIQAAPGFLGAQQLHTIARGSISDAEQAASFAHFITNFAELRRDLELSPDALANEIAGELPDALSDTEQQVIKERLTRVLLPVPGVERQAKVDRIVRRTGAHLDELAMVSDLRPVFDRTGEVVEGLVPLTTLKLVVHHTGALFPTIIEVRITEEELEQLCVEAERAKKKLTALKQLVKRQSAIALPESVMTLLEAPST